MIASELRWRNYTVLVVSVTKLAGKGSVIRNSVNSPGSEATVSVPPCPFVIIS